MKIRKSVRAYERWLRAQLKGEAVEKDLDSKHKLMAQGAFPFLRATYWRWAETILDICPDLAHAPSVLAIGDIHIENYGSWRDAEGRVVWGVNDFDEVAEMPYALDLVRLATSAVLAGVRGMGEGAVCRNVLAGYRAGLAKPRPFVLDRQHHWLREKVVVPEADRKKFWTKYDPANKKNKTRHRIPRAFRKALATTLPSECAEVAYWPRTAGMGSLGRPRWVGFATWQGAPVVREAKAALCSAWVRHHGGSQRLRCEEAAFGRYRSPNPWYSVRRGIVVRRLSPNDRKIELPSHTEDAPSKGFAERPAFVNAKMLAAMGADLAAIHLGSGNHSKAIMKDLRKRGGSWLRHAVAAATDQVRREQREWKKAARKP
jgi:hypothetical protein